ASEAEINLFTTSITATTRVSCGVTYDFRDGENPFKDYFDNFVMRFSGAFEKNARLENEVESLKKLKEAWSEGDTHIEAMKFAGELAEEKFSAETEKLKTELNDEREKLQEVIE
ncbi:5689_t:CDS:2, partial [Paraglomus brasilianum]